MHLSHNTLNSMKAILQIMKLQSFGIVIHKVYDKIHKTMTSREIVQVFKVNTSMKETSMTHHNVHLSQKITIIIGRKF